MAIHCIISNKLEKLADACGESLAQTNDDIFYRDIIVTQTAGLNRWLSLYLARRNRVFANFQFVKPNELIGQHIFPLLENHYEDSLFQQGFMKWMIYDILRSGRFRGDEDFRDIFQYCGNDEVKLLRLCTIIADLFDQYVIYRPALIEAWVKGREWKILGTNHIPQQYRLCELWQRKLFSALAEHIATLHEDLSGRSVLHNRVTLKNEFVRKVKERDPRLITRLQEIKQISFFGLSVITQYHYEIISVLAEIIDCNFYLVNPSGAYWYDIVPDKVLLRQLARNGKSEVVTKSQNNFLAWYGKSGQEFFNILFSNEEALNNWYGCFDETFSETLLGHVQESLYAIEPLKKTVPLDDSIRIVSCYTPLREVEVLYDTLLEYLDKNTHVMPGDILVMLTDTERYAPYIDAVFSSGSGGKVPYSIADKQYRGNNTPVDTILDLFAISRGIGDAEEIVSLAENSFVKKKFGFEDNELVREIVKAAVIRWGLNDDHISRDGVPAFNVYQSWQYGLKKIVLGYAMQGSCDIDDTVPLDTVEGAEALDGLRLYNLVRDINDFLSEIQRPRSLLAWKRYLMTLFDRFVHLDFDQDHFRSEFEKLLVYYSSDSITVPFNVIRDDMIALCTTQRHEEGFYNGKVTFCSMVPMRSVPHKVIAVLGLDETLFPGRVRQITFNIMDAKNLPGDRDPRLSNRYVFLESLISTQQMIYLSYVGYSTKTGEPLNPSSAIDDLISYVAEITDTSVTEVRKRLVRSYPLHGYAMKYQRGELPTYIADNILSEEKSTQLMPVSQGEAKKELTLSLSGLIAFFKNAVEWYCNEVLRIYYRDGDLLLPGEEKFEINKLDEWSINTRLVQKEPNLYHTLQKHEGALPSGDYGKIILEDLEKSVDRAQRQYQNVTDTKKKRKYLCAYKDIEGAVELFDNDLISFSVSSRFYKYKFAHYCKHLMLCTQQWSGDSLFIHKSGQTERFPRIAPTEAAKRIDTLVDIVAEGAQRPIPFTLDMAQNYEFPELKKLNTLWKELRDGASHGTYRDPDPYIKRAMPDFEFDEKSKETFDMIFNTVCVTMNESAVEIDNL